MPGANVQQAVPFLMVSRMERSLRYYAEGLGFTVTHKWVVEGAIRWCWLKRGGAGLMLQEFRRESGAPTPPEGVPGFGVTILFLCEDAIALYREFVARGIEASRPFVGNGMWVTSLRDPDGYRVEFESYTDIPEETVWDGDERER